MDNKLKPYDELFLPFDKDGRLQITAGLCLLEKSRLVTWSQEKTCFMPVSRVVFETSWQKEIDPVFGRFICWILFSSGAELFAKGLCLVNQVEIRNRQYVRSYPSNDYDINLWIKTHADAIKNKGQVPGNKYPVAHYRSLDYLIRGRRSPKSKDSVDIETPFSKLFRKVNASEDEENLILASYDLLRETIRNRDAHAYVPDVRDAHINLVSELYTDCFNIFIKWIPGGADVLNKWRENPDAY